MPEIKNQFTGGRMNKDLDERLVPKGEYRDAMNIQVTTSEGSDVGTVQNILGNKRVLGANFDDAFTIASIADEKNDMLYFLVWSKEVDVIISLKKNSNSVRYVLVDTNKNVLNFNPSMQITGINIIDGMMFWTDNVHEPKKINIERCRAGTTTPFVHTKLINEPQGIDISSAIDIEEKHITVIKKAPPITLDMQLASFRSKNPDKIYTAIITTGIDDDSGINNTSFSDSTRYNFSGLSPATGENEFNLKIETGVELDGSIVALGAINSQSSGMTGWQTPAQIAIAAAAGVGQGNIPVGTKIVFKAFDEDGSMPGLPVTDFSIKGIIADAYPADENTTYGTGIKVRITSMDGIPPSPANGNLELKYLVDLFDETENLFEFKFPRFSYRYKYEDGEYSPFAPFTQVAFLPGSFDYHPRKGYNLGMTNALNTIDLGGFIYPSMPEDVVSVDILFKDEPSPSIYVVDTIRPDDESISGGTSNIWDSIMGGGYYTIDSETVNNVLPSNQLLRPWDNVPKRALAQDITGSRIVYGNYVQGYDLITSKTPTKKYLADFNPQWIAFEDELSNSNKSIKTLREYQLGVVFVDKYGRETPVISNKSGTIPLRKNRADLNNRLQVSMQGTEVPLELTHYKFFIKETANEYYNMAMDRWYSAQDGNIWLAFPSSDRNKIDIDTFLILKKGTDSDALVIEAARYKVLAIEAEAPDYIKTSRILASTSLHSGGGTGGPNDIFGGDTVNSPLLGVKKFKMFYAPFHGTAGQNLDAIEDDLYLRFRKAGDTEVSDYYRINSITNDWDVTNAAALSDPNGNPAQYSIQLDRQLQSDVDFISDNPTNGLLATKIDDSATIEVYRYVVENKPQFDGRFFVKIYFDEVFRNNISKSFAGDLEYRVAESRKVYGLKDDHVTRHIDDVNYFLTNKKTMRDGLTNWDTQADPTEANDYIYGYYLDPQWCSFALYFRRYMKQDYGSGTETFHYAVGMPNGSGNVRKKDTDFNRSSHHRILALKPGGSDVIYPQDQQTTQWKIHPHTKKELKGHTANHCQMGYPGISHTFIGSSVGGPYAAIAVLADSQGFYAGLVNSFYETGEQRGDSPQDTDVWFIDAGPSKGYGTSTTQDLKWNMQVLDNDDLNSVNLGDVSTSPGFNRDGIYNNRNGDGIQTVGGTNPSWSMEIGFGGIEQAKSDAGVDFKWYDEEKTGLLHTTENFFNVGDWFTPTGLASNTNYSNQNAFVSYLAPGVRLKWKEDPENNVYSIGGTPAQINCLRHSTTSYLAKWNLGSNKYRSSVMSSNRGDMSDSTFSTYDTHEPGWYNAVGGCKAEGLSFNFSKNWDISDIEGELKWDPSTDGEIINGAKIKIPAFSFGGTTCIGTTLASDLTIYVETLVDPTGVTKGFLHQGMALMRYKNDSSSAVDDTLNNNLGPNANEFLVIRDIQRVPASGTITHYELVLGGYRKPMEEAHDHKIASTVKPLVGAEYTFVQVGVNGYSPNSEFNINTMGPSANIPCGKVGAVGYTLQFVEEVEPLEVLSENPAVFETEPKDSKDLDIYYEATSAIPINLNKDNLSDAFPIGSTLEYPVGGPIHTVVGHNNLNVQFDTVGALVVTLSGFGPYYFVSRPDGLELEVAINAINSGLNELTIDPFLYNGDHKLPYHNCYSFGNGVESNRIRDNYNLPFITNGVKASTTLEQEYNQEHRKYGLIYSGLYNSTSGVNNLNQFIQAENITKDVNPIYGSIQKLHARDSDLVTLCEDKCLRIMANKDAVFNADGNTNLTATSKVLGQTFTFSGEYGISKNPESFSSEAYRVYFTDKVRGAVLRLSKDGLTPISNYGMKDWFRDNLKIADSIIGSYDDRNDEYNVTLKRYPIVKVIGARKNPGDPYVPFGVIVVTPIVASFLSIGSIFSPAGFPFGTTILTKTNLGGGQGVEIQLEFPNISDVIDVSLFGNAKPYGTVANDQVVWTITAYGDNLYKTDSTVSYKEDNKGWVSFKSFKPENAISMANDYYSFSRGLLYKHYTEDGPRNTFYNIGPNDDPEAESSVTAILNANPGFIKGFNTLNYEGSQSKVDKFSFVTEIVPFQPNTNYSNQDIYNLNSKPGWYVENIITDKEEGYVNEFIEKEGKWFNNINRSIDINLQQTDTADFTFQGLGEVGINS